MKPIPAIVEKHVDVEHSYSVISVALAGERDAGNTAARHEQLGAAARETQKLRRLEAGRELLKVRAAWPASGPNAKGWGEFLKRLGIDQSTAWRLMHPEQAEPDVSCEPHENSDRDVKPANVLGGSGEVARGSYCTPAKYAAAVGPWDLDPFSNPRSHIVATVRCMLEDGGDGIADATLPGCFRSGREGHVHVAGEQMRVWLQPDYSFVDEAIEHYGHTRFCALLRFDPSTAWFAALWPKTRVIAIPFGERLEFEAPPGIETSSNPHAHAFFYADENDLTSEMRQFCILLRNEHTPTT
jgi:hypothetical protein